MLELGPDHEAVEHPQELVDNVTDRPVGVKRPGGHAIFDQPSEQRMPCVWGKETQSAL